jgi:hypothetical protein
MQRLLINFFILFTKKTNSLYINYVICKSNKYSNVAMAFTAGLFLTVVDPQNPPIQPENLPLRGAGFYEVVDFIEMIGMACLFGVTLSCVLIYFNILNPK